MITNRSFANVALWSVALLGFPIHTPANDVTRSRVEEGSTVVAGSGPFEVSGEPSSYAVAWVDAGSGAGSLSLSLFRTNEPPVVRRVSTDLDLLGRLFLEKTGDTTVIAWKARNGWRVGRLTVTPDSGAIFVETVLRFARSNQPIAMSFDGQRVLLLVDAGDERAFEPDHGELPQKSRIPVVEIPDLAGPTLIAIDLETSAATVLHRIGHSIGAGAIAPTSDGSDVAFVNPATGRIEVLRLDMTGSIRSGSSLGWAALGSVLALHETDGATLIGWTEERGDGSATVLARAGHAAAEVVTEVVSSPGRPAHGLLLSEGADNWAAWWEANGRGDEIVVGAWDGHGNPVCRTTLQPSAPVERTWLLGSGGQALLFMQSKTPEMSQALKVVTLTCDALSDKSEARTAAGFGVLTGVSGDVADVSRSAASDGSRMPAAPLGGASEPCDGYDNDGNGIVDDGCDRVCDAPQAAGPETRVTNATGSSIYSSLVWNGGGYGVAWYDARDGNEEIYFARLDTSGNRIGADVRVTSAAGESRNASVVWTGSGYGVAWYDFRDGNWEIYFARLDAAGNKVGSDVRVTNNTVASNFPSLVWTGSVYGVSWDDRRDGNYEIYFARLDAAGNKVGSDVRITNDSSASQYSSLVWRGGEYGVAWYDNRDGNYEIYFARLDAAGNKIGSDVRVTSAAGNSMDPSLAWTGSEYGVSWLDGRDGNNEIYFVRIDAAGTKIGSDVRITSNASASYDPALVWTAGEYGVAWWDSRDGNTEVYFARIGASGTKIGSDVRITNNASTSSHPSLVWTGSQYGVSWDDFRDGNYEIYFAGIRCCDDADADGYTECAGDTNDQDPTIHPGALEVCDGRDNDADGAIDEGCDTICDAPQVAALATRVTNNTALSEVPSPVWTGSGYGVSWQDSRDGNAEIYFARLDGSGTKMGGDVRVTNATLESANPWLVWTGSGYGVSWNDRRDGNYEIYFTRMDAAGTKIGADVRLTNAAADSVSPSLVWTGSEYGVSWVDSRDGNQEIYFARIDAAGNKIGADVRVTNAVSSSTYPSLVWTGSGYGLSWSDARDGGPYEIYFARIDAAGVKIGSDVRVTNAGGSSDAPSLVWAGSEYGVSWHDWRDGNAEIYFARLHTSGDKIGTDVRVTNASLESGNPSLVWTGTEYGVSWNDRRDGNYELYFIRIDATGRAIDRDLRVTIAASDSVYPYLVWTGIEYGVAWQDARDGNNEIYFARIACCDDADADGYSECAGDTNDQDPTIHPGALEVCDGRDNDSDGTIDEGCDTTCDAPQSLPGSVIADAAEAALSSLSWTGTGYGVVWASPAAGSQGIALARLNLSGNKLGADVPVSSGSVPSYLPSIVWTGKEYGVAWQANNSYDPPGRIWFARFDASGSRIGSDVSLPADPTRFAFEPTLAWTGSGYGMAWVDYRTGRAAVHFARLDDQGNRVGPELAATEPNLEDDAPTLAWNGNGFGVAWRESRDGNFEIYFARLDAQGNKIGGDVRVTNDPAYSDDPFLVWNGSEYGIAWIDNRSGSWGVYFARLSPEGTKVGGDILISANFALEPWLAWTGSEYGIAWVEGLEVYFARLDSGGWMIGSATPASGPSSSRPSLVWNGTDYALVWEDAVTRPPDRLLFTRVRCCDDADADGYSECAGDTNDQDSTIHPGATELCDGFDNDSDGTIDEGCNNCCNAPAKAAPEARVTNAVGDSSSPSLAWNSAGYGVAWQDGRDGNNEIYFARFDATGAKIGTDVRVTTDAADSSEPSLVWTGRGYGVAWHDFRNGNYEIYFARFDASGNKVGSDVRVTSAAGDSVSPSLVWTGSEYGVAWHDVRDGNYEIYFARIYAAGTKIGGDVHVTNAAGNSAHASLAWNGNGYGMSWQDERDGNLEIYVATLDSLGAKIGSDTRLTNQAAQSLQSSLVWAGHEYGVSWLDCRNGNCEIYFARFDAAGVKIGADVRVTNDAADSRDPSLVWTGCQYAVAWHDLRDGNYEAYFAKLDASGSKIGTDLRVTNAAGDSRFLSAIWTGSEYGMSWQDARDGNNEIYFARIACAPVHQNICGGEFVPLADSFVDAGSPNANFGGNAHLRVGSAGPNQPTRRALLEFDLAGAVAPGSTIQRALLQLYAEQGGDLPYGFEVRSVTSPWNEATVTWNSQPTYGAAYGATSFEAGGGLVNVDVTDLVTHWVTGRLGQTSIALHPASELMDMPVVSREADAPNRPGPRLIVSCSVNAAPVPRDSFAGDAAQRTAIERLRGESQVLPTIKLSRGAVRFATFQIPVPAEHRLDPLTRARWFLSSYRDVVGLDDPGIQMQLARRSPDGQHLVFRQRQDGVPVHPAELIVHLQGDDVTGLSGAYSPDITLTSSPQLTAAQATRLALADAGAGSAVGGDVQLRYVDTRLLGEETGQVHLTWQVPVLSATAGGQYFIDALDGSTVHVDTASLEGFDLTLNSALGTDSPGNVPGCWFWNFSEVEWFNENGQRPLATPDAEGRAAFDSIRIVDNYWRSTFGRDSYDRVGGTVGMYLDVTDDGGPWLNAHYTYFCNIFEFGNNMSTRDSVGHEYTHAVIRNEADLEYQNVSGALNESYADVFGFMVDVNNFTIGEGWASLDFRDMSNPPVGSPSQPDHVSPLLSGDGIGQLPWVSPVCKGAGANDCGWVHINSGIPNKAAYLMIRGGVHNGYYVRALGRDKTARLLYTVIAWGLTSSATFDDARNAAVGQAELFERHGLFSFTASDVCQIRNAYASVGIGSGDADCDGIEDHIETDDDGDGIPDISDNCPTIWNAAQSNVDGDAQGNACDNDIDNDGVLDDGDNSGVVGDHLCTLGSTAGCDDNCRYVFNPGQTDSDRDGISDACDDSDGDSIPDGMDNCPGVPNRDQGDMDGDKIGDLCDPNMDGDQSSNSLDNCPSIPNDGQANRDGDRYGDACDLCPDVWNSDNEDCDRDGMGNTCDPDDDNDGVVDENDNCPCTPNPDQVDLDGNGIGFKCDHSEQQRFFLDPGALQEYQPIKWPVSLDIPVQIGVAICPACAGNDLPEGFVAELDVQMTTPFRARIVDGSGNTRAWGSDAQTVHRLRFQPEPYGFSRFAFSPRIAATADTAGSPDYVAPDQVRYLLELFPADGTDRTQEYAVSVEHFQCEDADGDGFGPVGGATCPGGSTPDCDDVDWRRSPGRLELCDGLDNNCDGMIDGYATSCGVGACGRTGLCTAGVDTCAPGLPASETCDGQDNDCDGTVDDVTIAGQSQLHVERGLLSWGAISGASGYDVMRGSLETLRAGGDFTAATKECLGHNEPATSISHSAEPASGKGYWYLVRATACNVGGTYDSGAPSQSGSRDAGIEASTVECGNCPHSRCEAGGPMTPSCGSCTAAICAADAHCCGTVWDQSCVAAVRTVCHNLSCGESTGACSHSPCAEGAALTGGCDSPPADTSCVTAICEVDSFCCSATWDATCVERVSSVCGKQCE